MSQGCDAPLLKRGAGGARPRSLLRMVVVARSVSIVVVPPSSASRSGIGSFTESEGRCSRRTVMPWYVIRIDAVVMSFSEYFVS